MKATPSWKVSVTDSTVMVTLPFMVSAPSPWGRRMAYTQGPLVFTLEEKSSL